MCQRGLLCLAAFSRRGVSAACVPVKRRRTTAKHKSRRCCDRRQMSPRAFSRSARCHLRALLPIPHRWCLCTFVPFFPHSFSLFPPRSFAFYDELAKEAGEAGIGIDVCLCAKSYADAATLALLPQRTGGALRYCGNFSGAHSADVRGLQAFIEHAVLKTRGWDGVLKVRCSKGLQVAQYRAHCFDPTKPEIAIACLDSESTISVELTQTGTFELGGCVCIQAALLYTRADGKRMIRVHTLRLDVCDTVTNLFKHADLHACAVAFAKSSCAMVRDAGTSCFFCFTSCFFCFTFFCFAKLCCAILRDAGVASVFFTRIHTNTCLLSPPFPSSPPYLIYHRRSHDYGGPPPAEH